MTVVYRIRPREAEKLKQRQRTSADGPRGRLDRAERLVEEGRALEDAAPTRINYP